MCEDKVMIFLVHQLLVYIYVKAVLSMFIVYLYP